MKAPADQKHAADGAPRLRVSTWLKMWSIGLIAGLLIGAAWVLHEQLGRPDRDALGLLLGSVMIFPMLLWLLTRVYSLCSIELHEEGVSQASFFGAHGLGEQRTLRWEDIDKLGFVKSSYHFIGVDGTEMELHTSLFSDRAKTFATVRGLVPARLLSQLDGPGAIA